MSDGDPFISRKRILIHISKGLDSILILIKHFLFVLKISKKIFFFKERQGNIYRDMNIFCPYLVKYSPDILMKKTKKIDILKADNKSI